MGPLTSGVLIGRRYRLLWEVGRGGMGVVWQAHDLATQRSIAIKLLDLALLPDADLRDHYRDRFLRECAVTAKLKSPHIPEVYDKGAEGDRVYLVMEFIDGPTLAAFIVRFRPLDVSVSVAIGGQLCLGLMRAHEAGIIHRDLKPSNIMIDRDGTVKIMDFGVARVLGGTPLTSTGAVPGTCAYMAPELFEAGTADLRADFYALGCVITEMLTGERLFPDARSPAQQMHAHRERQPRPLQTVRSDVPADLCQLLSDLLAKQPHRRPESVYEVFGRLQEMLPGRGDLAPARQCEPDPTWPWRLAAPSLERSTQEEPRVIRPRRRRRSGPSVHSIREARDKALDLAQRGYLADAIALLAPLLDEAEPFHGSRAEIVFELRVALADLLFTDNQCADARRQYVIAREFAVDHPGANLGRLAMIEGRIEDCDDGC